MWKHTERNKMGILKGRLISIESGCNLYKGVSEEEGVVDTTTEVTIELTEGDKVDLTSLTGKKVEIKIEE